METQLDHTYLRPGIISRAAAVGLAAIGVGAGVLLACWGLSFFWHVDDAVLRRLDAIAKQTAGLSDTFREIETTLGQRTTESIDALGGKIDALEPSPRRDQPASDRDEIVPGGSGQPESTRTGHVIKREVTVFNSITHEGGDVTTGWNYKDGASDGAADKPVLLLHGHRSKWRRHLQIDLAYNGQRLFNGEHGQSPAARGGYREVPVVDVVRPQRSVHRQ